MQHVTPLITGAHPLASHYARCSIRWAGIERQVEMATRRSTRKRGATTSLAASVDDSASSSLELDNEGASSASRSKRSRRTPKRAVTWQWEGDGGKWTNYESSLGAQLSTALLKGDRDITLQVATNAKLKVRFAVMTQMNVSTGWQRNVRCVPSRGSREEKGKWEWQDEHGKWSAYAPSVQRLLRGCELCGVEETEIEAHGRKYRVDLENKKQVNVETGVERRVRHTSSLEDTATQDADMAEDDSSELAPSTSIPTATSATTVGATPTTSLGNDEGEEEEPKPKPRKKRSASSAKKKKEAESNGASGESADGGPTMVTNKGKVPVDYECKQKVGKAHVFCEGGEFWDAMLNQTNLKNNNNKFYILQLLEDNTSRRYSVWFRWGRVGKTGQHMLTECGTDLEGAKQHFTKKFFDKTVNSWDNRTSFVKHAGKYDLLKMDYETKEETDQGDEGEQEEDVDGGEVGGAKKRKPIESKLDLRLQALIELICNVQSMEDAVVEMKYDVKRAPLGKLTTDQIRSGYAALKKIEDCITRNHFGDQLVEACDAFYTRVPHSFGMQRPPLIRTKEQVREKLALLEALSDIQIAMKVLDNGKKHEEELHPIDRHYKGLQCQLTTVKHEDKLFGLIEKYVKQTHAKTHSQYRMEVTDVFEMERSGEKEAFNDVGNRQLLWHGSRLTNWVGILSQGLRIAPPEAPVTGYMFGKGIYFADMCSKSANYCFASKLKNEGLLVLSEVALGQTNDLLAADYTADKLPPGKHSTKGLGRIAPDPAHTETLGDGVVVPLGPGVDTGVHNPHGYTLNYNEFVVYDTSQVKMRYLVKLKFHFK